MIPNDSCSLLFFLTGDAVIITDTAGRVLEINPAAKQVLGVPADVVRGVSLGDFLPELSAVTGDSGMTGMIRREITLTVHDTPREFSVTGRTIVPADKGNEAGFVLLLREIGREKANDLALLKSEQRFHELVDLLPEVVYECDLTGKFSYVNDNSLRFFGYDRTDLERGLNLFDHIVPEDKPRAAEGIRQIAAGRKSAGAEFTGVKRDGTRFPFLVYTTRVMENDRCTGMRGILIDMTGRKKAESAMQQAVKKLSLLNSLTRHDILNKLTALSAYLSLAREGVTDHASSGHIDRCEQIVRSLNEHVEFMRDYQEIGVRSPVWQAPEQVVTGVIGSSPTHAYLKIIAPPRGFEIFADPLFPRVIDNLLDNSVRHGGRVTTVVFAVQEVPGGLIFSCEDNGTGISRDHKTNIFEKGFGKHTGLGLFLSREILGITGISIQETGEPGRGARFEILVPKESYRRVPVSC